ncbi:hypothetical protein QTP88_001431 [Uroleucon formosanum]
MKVGRQMKINSLTFCNRQSVLGQVHDALVEVSELTKDPKIKSESLSLANYEFSYDFILSVVIWYELLSAINKVSKSLQSETMELSNAVQLLKVEKGFELSKKTAQQLCEDIGTQPIFKQSRVLKKSKQFDYECNDTRAVSNEQKFYQDYFLAVVDQAIVSINQRFERLSQHSENFGFLYNIENLKLFEDETLRKHCMDLEILLKDEENVMDQDTALSVTSVTMSEFSGVENNIQLEIAHQNSVETHTNINESSNTETNNTEEDDTCDTPIVNITEGL